MTTLLLAALLAFSSDTTTEAADNMKAYPPAETGMVRHVLMLPAKNDESLLKVELIVGKTVQTDNVNRYFFAGKIEEEIIKGWGFPKYLVKNIGPMAGTRIGVDPDEPKTARFIPLGGDPFLIRYNSRLPLVIYTPEGSEVRYRIWSTPPESKPVNKG